jgi:hypothetical protein
LPTAFSNEALSISIPHEKVFKESHVLLQMVCDPNHRCLYKHPAVFRRTAQARLFRSSSCSVVGRERNRGRSALDRSARNSFESRTLR